MTDSITIAPNTRQTQLIRRVRFIVAFTITYNIFEAIIALFAGHEASSSALLGFGLDSSVEVLSAIAVAWQFAAPDPRRREKLAMRLIAISFFGLSIIVVSSSVRALLGYSHAEHSTIGIILAIASVIIMPVVSYFERITGRELGSHSAVADSKQTLICTYLSAVLLVGLVLNSTLGWAWADPVAALVIAGLAGKEGVDAWNGDACCAPTLPVDTDCADTACSSGACDC
ncbi:MAG: cation transporter [Actinomycetaceae bacterium]|nr:cation transporter [Actinomycetaceae bacterium]